MAGPERPGPSARAASLAAIEEGASSLPVPVAGVARAVARAHHEGDRTGVAKRCYELGAAVVRYGLSVALALSSERLGDNRAPKTIGRELDRAARMSDGQWCALLRRVAGPLRSDPALAPLFDYAWGKPLAALVKSRNDFTHAGGSGDEAPRLVAAVLAAAEDLLAIPLPETLELGLRDGPVTLSPWLPQRDGIAMLIDAPHVAGGTWRSFDGATGEHREAPELHAAVRALVGEGTDRPMPLCEEPPLVGRGRAVLALRRAGERAVSGAVSVVLLTGVQGIGRSRLCQTLRQAHAGLGFSRVLEATCHEERRGFLRPVRRAVKEHLDLAGVERALD